MIRRTRGLLLAAVLLTVPGSGCSRGPKLVKVTGRLTYKGAPVPSTDVKFIPEDGSRPSHNVTDRDGHFNLKYTRSEFGVSRGRHTVVLTYDPVGEEDMPSSERMSKDLKAVVAQYSSPAASSLHFEVKEDGQVIDIPLD
jgi:hypothetical protein